MKNTATGSGDVTALKYRLTALSSSPCINGAFKGNDLAQGIGDIAYGHPSIIVIEIPERRSAGNDIVEL